MLPRYVRKQPDLINGSDPKQDHSHACGKRLMLLDEFPQLTGILPRMWEKVSVFFCLFNRFWNTPTHVGKGQEFRLFRTTMKEYSHACGKRTAYLRCLQGVPFQFVLKIFTHLFLLLIWLIFEFADKKSTKYLWFKPKNGTRFQFCKKKRPLLRSLPFFSYLVTCKISAN